MTLSVSDTYTDIIETVFSSAIAGKAWLATGAVILALVQIVTAARIYGRLRLPFTGTGAGIVHRWSGRLAVLLTLPVAFHCIFILGFQSGDARVAAHSIFGTFIYGVLAAKLLVLRGRGYPSWALPVAGGGLFLTLAALWWTSSYWYFTEVEFAF